MKIITLLLSLMFYSFQSVAQVTYEGNNSTNSTTDYVGWDNAITNPLRIKHEANYGIEFYTNTGGGTFGTPKMMLDKSGSLGIGTGTSIPSSWLHVKSTGTKETFRTDVPANYDNYWRMYRNGTEYGRFINFDNAFAFYIQAPRGNLRLASGNTGTAIASFEIVGSSGSNAGSDYAEYPFS